MPSSRVFELGIVMAGAISAGAYSAGVMDFLMEALDAYDEAKKNPDWDGPVHDVRIPVMAGASAGGMTAAISALHAFHGLAHVWPGQSVPEKADNRLYSSWVSDISIESLLATTDLDGGRDKNGLKSALCCDVLDRIVNDAFTLNGPVRARNWIGRGDDRSLRVMLTLTNVRGVPYSFPLFGADSTDEFGMLNHGDYLDFTVGIAPRPSNVSHALDITNTTGAGWDLFRTAALATGAFPVGLAPRIIERPASDYENQQRVGYDDSNRCFVGICPDSAFETDASYRFISVDGGTIDNEPLELARRYLSGGGHNDQNGETADRAVVLIAPFPNFRKPPLPDSSERMLHILPLLASALIDQARFKPDELEQAANDKIFSRFMICPIRSADGNLKAQQYPIASGALGGFSGFLHESFRRHDYLLGRRNAQAFLRWNFALPQENELFDDFEEGRDRWHVRNAEGMTASVDEAAEQALPPQYFARTVGGTEDSLGLPIIPLVKRLRTPIEIGEADMPKPETVSREDLHAQIQTRAESAVATLVDVDLRQEFDKLLHIHGVDLEWIAGGGVRHVAKKMGANLVSERATSMVDQALDDIAAAFPRGQP
jgi:Patatin-like phospholipase